MPCDYGNFTSLYAGGTAMPIMVPGLGRYRLRATRRGDEDHPRKANANTRRAEKRSAFRPSPKPGIVRSCRNIVAIGFPVGHSSSR
jgi:hypothetical protein